MKKIFLSFAVLTALTIVSCGGEKKSTEVESTETNENICFYSYDDNKGTQVRWTAFKTTDKVAVGGQFDQVNAKAGEKSTKITDLLQTVVFNIPVSSTNTANEDRDAKIVKHFFGTMKENDIILGQVKSVTGDNEKGNCVFYLTLNNIEKEVNLEYIVEDAIIKISGEIDVLNWNGNEAIAAINKACEALHTGADGVSKTWSTIELAIEANLKKECH